MTAARLGRNRCSDDSGTEAALKALMSTGALLRFAWISVPLIPVAFVAVMLIGEGLIFPPRLRVRGGPVPTARRDPARRHSSAGPGVLVGGSGWFAIDPEAWVRPDRSRLIW